MGRNGGAMRDPSSPSQPENHRSRRDHRRGLGLARRSAGAVTHDRRNHRSRRDHRRGLGLARRSAGAVMQVRQDHGHGHRRRRGERLPPYRVKARLRQWTDDGHQLGAENTEGEQRTRNGRNPAQHARPTSAPTPNPFCAFCVLCGSPDCDPGTHLPHPSSSDPSRSVSVNRARPRDRTVMREERSLLMDGCEPPTSSCAKEWEPTVVPAPAFFIPCSSSCSQLLVHLPSPSRAVMAGGHA